MDGKYMGNQNILTSCKINDTQIYNSGTILLLTYNSLLNITSCILVTIPTSYVKNQIITLPTKETPSIVSPTILNIKSTQNFLVNQTGISSKICLKYCNFSPPSLLLSYSKEPSYFTWTFPF